MFLVFMEETQGNGRLQTHGFDNLTNLTPPDETTSSPHLRSTGCHQDQISRRSTQFNLCISDGQFGNFWVLNSVPDRAEIASSASRDDTPWSAEEETILSGSVISHFSVHSPFLCSSTVLLSDMFVEATPASPGQKVSRGGGAVDKGPGILYLAIVI